VGCNGCGKSTLVRHLNGLLTPLSGRVIIDGLDTSVEQNLPLIRRKAGMVFQNPDNQLFASVVEEDVAFGVENMCLPPEEIKKRVEAALRALGMSDYKQHPPHRLSGGQKQKVAIAGILAMEPECIVLDEPSSMLDPSGKKDVMEAVRNLNCNRGITVVYVTHDMAETLYSDRIIALAGGEIAYNGPPADLFFNKDNLAATGLQAPPVLQLAGSLNAEGLKLPGAIKTPEELVDKLCQLNL